MPAKIELTEKQISEIETLAVFLTQEQIADYFGISKRTFNNMRERDKEIDRLYNKGKAKGIAKIANGLFQTAVAGNTSAQMFYLKTQAGWRENNEQSNVQSEPQALNITFEVKDPVGDVKITEGKSDN